MKVRDIMTKDVEWIGPETTLTEAADRMRSLNVGYLPVFANGRMTGVLTDRDIVIRAVADGVDTDDATVREVMSNDPTCCYEEDAIADAAHVMEQKKVRRLPVLDRDQKLVGVVSLGDFPRQRESRDLSGEVLEAVAFRRPQQVP